MEIQMLGSEWFSERPGGLNRYFQDLAKALSNRQHGVSRLRARAFGTPPGFGESWGPTGLPLPVRVLRAQAPARPASGTVVRDRHFPLYGGGLLSSRRSPNELDVRHFHGPWAAESAVSGDAPGSVRWKRRIEYRSLGLADHVIVLSKSFGDLVRGSYDVDPDRISVIPPGVDLPRAVSSVEKDENKVVCVRRLETRMGIDVLIRAWADVARKRPDAMLQIVGDGSQREHLTGLVEELGLGGSIRLSGRLPQSQLDKAYDQAVLSVVPSIELEGFGMIVLESLARGCVPVVTECGGLPDGVRDLDETLIVPRGDPSALADRIVTALCGQRPTEDEAREHASRFSWQAAADRHIELYRDLLTAKRAARRFG